MHDVSQQFGSQQVTGFNAPYRHALQRHHTSQYVRASILEARRSQVLWQRASTHDGAITCHSMSAPSVWRQLESDVDLDDQQISVGIMLP